MSSSPTDGAHGAQRRVERDDVQALLSRALELRESGREDWLRVACREFPELEGRVAELAEHAHALPGIVARASALDPRIGVCLGGRFQLCERIGAGAMGVVYLAQDRELRRNVACKVVRHGLMAPEKALERFEREARAMAVVQHPAVATIYDRGRTDDGQVYIVMELIDGVPLSDVLELVQRREERPRSDDPAWLTENFRIAPRDESSYLRTAVGWIADLSLGLEAVHQAGVLHRDVKPSNILLRREGGPALLDFGIALLEDSDPITRGVTSLGTPSYMPPEALLPDVKRTPAGDVYGLAATLYHLVTLHAPYEGSPTQVLAALATREPVPAAERRPGLPRDLQAILDKGMHRDPSERYASAAEFEADLRAFLEFRPIVARPVTRFERGLRRLVRSKVARGAAAALLAVLVLVGAMAWREHHLDVRRAQHAELARHFPPNFGVVGLANRGFLDPADQRALAQLLDAAAEVAVDPLPTFLLRATERQDRGEAEGAAQDMRVVAEDVGTPFARELAARYGSAAPGTIGIAALDLDGLPETTCATDRYLLAYHLLRQERVHEGIQLLSDDEVRLIPHAEELFLASTVFTGLPLVERRRLGVQRYADLVRLEGRIGQRTATTAHIAARMLVLQGRFDEAEPLAEEGVELAPRSHVVRVNAGWAAFGERHLAEAREHLRVARELRPNYEKPLKEAIWVEIADRRFDEAQRLVREAGPELRPASPTWAGYWTGVILTYAALDARAAGDEAECERRVKEALRSFATARKRTHDKDDNPTDVAFGIATALTDRDEETVVLCLAKFVADQPTNWWRLSVFATHLPKDLSAEATAAVRQIFDALGVRSLPTASK